MKYHVFHKTTYESAPKTPKPDFSGYNLLKKLMCILENFQRKRLFREDFSDKTRLLKRTKVVIF